MFPTSPPCGALLFKPFHFISHLHHVKRISTHYSRSHQHQRHRKPFSIYLTQDFSNWFKWFIPQNEESIETWKISLIITNDSVYNYQQSQAWDALYPKCQQKSNSPLQLAFSLFTDWSNLLSNKAGGKQVSLGILALNFLNLPPTSQWKAQNTFLSGLVPEPSQPNMMTIKNMLKIFIDEMVQLYSGIIIQTSCYPHGQMVVVRLGCLIGDLVANHKAAGFASHFATQFFSWCNCPKADIVEMKLGKIRKKSHVKDYSQAFQEVKNEAECTRMVKHTGIRWSKLNCLHY
ncbi:hypothetical protein O181_091695 [Austropuccinia psidii MF-1]|uniref:Uncharacterized protein n=1 Tax=Austropuccinia psidii MF-1 TaxID=1389203 RepID=A0A9Q3IY97_9BASI|nr:hypothetical protein [Austropuccinia psidii MF-1]